jgi:hypothetical protein
VVQTGAKGPERATAMDAINTELLNRLRSALTREQSLLVGLGHEIIASTTHLGGAYAAERIGFTRTICRTRSKAAAAQAVAGVGRCTTIGCDNASGDNLASSAPLIESRS